MEGLDKESKTVARAVLAVDSGRHGWMGAAVMKAHRCKEALGRESQSPCCNSSSLSNYSVTLKESLRLPGPSCLRCNREQ